MAAQVRFLDTDETTVLTNLNQGNIETPETGASKKIFVQNFGTTDAEEVTVSIDAVGTNDGEQYVETALDAGGSPGAFGTDDLDLGTIAPLDSVPIWTRIVHPAGLTADANPRRAKLTASYLTT